ncbi:sulfotransferase domain-containing protein [Gracilibacillus dipsosauri]|uniref:sulfotransferase domain-containing protein n=1 Tax=Gracilibacillus dipsosauri TaxID=178340 RepID=UPI00240A0855
MTKIKYVIIGGISKAGTTSLFEYLVNHPQVSGSSIKQTNFFLDKDLQCKLKLKSLYDYNVGLEAFLKFFPFAKENTLRVEATPDYLYSPNTPKRLREFFDLYPGKVVFILRDPVTRFTSFFYYGKQQGLIPQEMSLLDFYQESKSYMEDFNPCLMAYKTGFYCKHINKYLETLGTDRVLVLCFEDMKRNPHEFMSTLSTNLSIDSSFYATYNFQIKNSTTQVRSQYLGEIYMGLRAWYFQNFYKSKAGILTARLLRSTISRFYRWVNHAPLKKNLEYEILSRLRDDYREEVANLESLLGRNLPWK